MITKHLRNLPLKTGRVLFLCPGGYIIFKYSINRMDHVLSLKRAFVTGRIKLSPDESSTSSEVPVSSIWSQAID